MKEFHYSMKIHINAVTFIGHQKNIYFETDLWYTKATFLLSSVYHSYWPKSKIWSIETSFINKVPINPRFAIFLKTYWDNKLFNLKDERYYIHGWTYCCSFKVLHWAIIQKYKAQNKKRVYWGSKTQLTLSLL